MQCTEDDLDVSIEGKYFSDAFSYLEFGVKKCECSGGEPNVQGCPAENNPNNCYSQTAAAAWFKDNSVLSVFYSDSYADFKDKDQTLKFYINDVYYVNVNEKIDKRSEFFLKKGVLD